MKSILSIYLALTAAAAIGQTTDFPSPSIRIEIDPNPDHVKGFLVSDDGSHTLNSVTIDFESSQTATVNGSFTLNPSDTRQKIDGFGFAITGSAAYNLSQMKPEARKQLLIQIFSQLHGYGCSLVRVPIGCSDFSLSQYTCCDSPGIENFSLTEEETRYIIPILQEIQRINPDVKVVSAPWTAPRWMKTNGNWTGGNLKSEYYGDYATYFVKWIQAFADHGISIYAVTPQNEPLNTGNSASMYMSWSEQTNFVKNALGPKFVENGLKTKIFVFDHNYNYDNITDQNHYPLQIYKDTQANKYVAGAAYHNYSGNAAEMTYIHNSFPDKELLFTEWTAGDWSWPGAGINAVTSDARALIFDVLNNWGQGSIVWNLMLDSDHGPFRPGGCSTGNGAVDIRKGSYDALTFNSFYYVMCAAAAAVSPLSYLIGHTGLAGGVECLTFSNGGGFGAILMNTDSAEKKVRIKDGTRSFVVSLPPKSLFSCKW